MASYALKFRKIPSIVGLVPRVVHVDPGQFGGAEGTGQTHRETVIRVGKFTAHHFHIVLEGR